MAKATNIGIYTYNRADNEFTTSGGSEAAPCNFASAYAADLASGYDNAGNFLVSNAVPAKGMSLTRPVKPADSKALKIRFQAVNKVSVANQYIVVNGTDLDGNVQSEILDFSNSEGTQNRTTTKYYATITTFDAQNGIGQAWNDGSRIYVSQNRFGVIWNYVTDYAYKVDCTICYFGTGSADSWFASQMESVFFANLFFVNNRCDVRVGYRNPVSYLETANYGSKGSYWSIAATAYNQSITAAPGTSNTRFGLYGSSLCQRSTYYPTLACYHVELIDSDVRADPAYSNSTVAYAGSIVNLTLLRATQNGGSSFCLWKLPTTQGYLRCIATNGSIYSTNYILIQKCVNVGGVYDAQFYGNPVDGIQYSSMTLEDFAAAMTTARCSLWYQNAYIQENFSINIKVVDELGAALGGVVVNCYNSAGAPVWTEGSIITQAGTGAIVQQSIEANRFTQAGTGHSPSTIVKTSYGPFRFVFTKTGYSTVTLEQVILDAPVKWLIELPVFTDYIGNISEPNNEQMLVDMESDFHVCQLSNETNLQFDLLRR